MPATNGSLFVLQSQTGSGTPATWVTLGCFRNNSFNGTTAEIDANSKCDPDFETSIPGRLSGEFSGELQLQNDAAAKEDLRNLWLNKTVVAFRQVNTDDLTDFVKGSGYITAYSEEHPDNDLSIANITIKLTGGITFA